MSGAEALVIIALVGTLVSAFKDGTELVKQLRERRRLKEQAADGYNELRTQELEQSLANGGRSVQKHYDWGYSSLGKKFEQGDVIAHMQMNQILISLQGQIIFNLKAAWNQDSSLNYQRLQESSDSSKQQATDCLIQLHHRLLLECSSTSTGLTLMRPRPPPPPLRDVVEVDAYGRPINQSRTSTRGLFSTTPRRRSTPSNNMVGTTTEVQESGRLFNRFRKQNTRRSSDQPERPTIGNIRSITPPEQEQIKIQEIPEPRPPMLDRRDSDESYRTCASDGTGAPEDGPDQVRPETTPEALPSTSSDTGSVAGVANQVSTARTSVSEQSQSSSVPYDKSPIIQPLLKTNTWSNQNLLPGEHNNYRGLCKCAYRLQTGRFAKAVRVSDPKATNYRQLYWCCKDCYFECRPKRGANGLDGIDSAIYTMGHGINKVSFRWSFLFRSHVMPPDRSNQKFACVFCSARNAVFIKGVLQPLKVMGLDQLIAHIVLEHTGEGKWPQGEVLYRMNCAVRGELEPREDWDIFLGSG